MSFFNPQPKVLPIRPRGSGIDWSAFEYPKGSIKLTPAQFRKLKLKVFARDNYTCQICDNRYYKYRCEYYLTPHHIIPTGRIRLDIEPNLLTACFWCQNKLHAGELGISVNDLIEKYRERLKPWLSSWRYDEKECMGYVA